MPRQRSATQPVTQGFAVQEFGNQIRHIVMRAYIVDGEDVGVV